MSARAPCVSVIMVSYRTGPALFAAIEAVLAEDRVGELVLVNHDNPPADIAWLEDKAEAAPRLKIIHTGANLGFSRGCNIGAAQAGCPFLLFLNPDTLLEAGAAAQLVDTAKQGHEPVVVGARIAHADGREQRGGRRGELTLSSAFAGFLGLSRIFTGVRDVHLENQAPPTAAIDVSAVSGAALMMTRVGFDQLHGFDEGYFLHVEDLDVCRRARDLGGSVLYEPRAHVRHHGATSQVSRFKVEHWKAAGLVRYFSRHGGRFGPLKAMLAAPLIWGALMARTALMRLRG